LVRYYVIAETKVQTAGPPWDKAERN